MMGEIEGIGEMVTGGLVAGAIEPVAGGSGNAVDGGCLNCATPLAGPYCSACGQKARAHRSLAAFFHDLVQGLFNFEGKVWHTLPMLAWKPGEMTRRYIAGERARFVSPVALYLFTVFLTFAVLNFTGTISPDFDKAKIGIRQSVAAEKTNLAKLEAERKLIAARHADLAAIDRRIARQKEDVDLLERTLRGQPIETKRLDEGDGPKWLRNAVVKIQSNPQAFILRVQDSTSKFSWLLIPLSVPFLWLLFPLSRRFRLYDHTVFVTYSLSFMMMLVIAGGLLVSIGAPGIASFLFFVPPVHMYRQLKGAYSLSRFGALWRTVALVAFAFIASILFFVTMLAIGLFD